MVAYIGRLAVVERRWIDEDDFRLGTALCQAVPGSTSMQAAAYVGLRTRGLGGAVAAYVGFGLPAFSLMLAMSLAYDRAVAVHAVTAALAGLRALVVAIVVNAAWTFGRSAIHTVGGAALAATAAVLFLGGGSPFSSSSARASQAPFSSRAAGAKWTAPGKSRGSGGTSCARRPSSWRWAAA